jgi:hypothetical protein
MQPERACIFLGEWVRAEAIPIWRKARPILLQTFR